ncbi:hypothetical protein VTN00DRAFT_3643 [Thermoascus crustaceus]|uniref:uncharacterized protein n=1 Tax=Thermoascus crustaceus TaxID=5088 RepID=UPI003743248C
MDIISFYMYVRRDIHYTPIQSEVLSRTKCRVEKNEEKRNKRKNKYPLCLALTPPDDYIYIEYRMDINRSTMQQTYSLPGIYVYGWMDGWMDIYIHSNQIQRPPHTYLISH